MTKKLEEFLNLPSIEEAKEQELDVQETESTEMIQADLSATLMAADKIDNALPQVTGLEALDRDMDSYAQKAMDTFQTLVDLGHNVEDRHAAAIFDVASKMMGNAITAKTAKMDKKLKMIELQLRKAKLDADTGVDDGSISGQGVDVTTDRNALLDALAQRIKDK